MRVQCDVCEKAVAQVVCCADEAALCLACDEQVHAANKLASKHHRLRLLPDQSLPVCDICQEKTAFIFCLEDRALVCRECDLCIHAANTLAAGHHRFLATGVRVALDKEDAADAPLCKPNVQPPASKSSIQPPASTAAKSSVQPPARNLQITPTNNPSAHAFPIKKSSIRRRVGAPPEQVQNSFKQLEEWQNSQSVSDVSSGYPLADAEFSKSDLARLSDQEWMMDLSFFDEPAYAESQAEVPQALDMSTMSGFAHSARLEMSSKEKSRQDLSVVPDFDDVSVVPDLMSFMALVPPLKRQRTVLGN